MTNAALYKRTVILLLIIYASVQVYCINQLTINDDEGSFASYGVTILKLHPNKDVLLYESKLPITALNMIPRAAEQIINPHLKKTWPASTSDVIHGRYISLLFSILLGLLIFKWSKEIYSEKTALIVFSLYLLCPNFLAHGIFVSSDIFACFFMTLALYFFWKFSFQFSTKYFFLMSVATGFAQISKFSMFHLFIIFLLLALIVFISKKDVSRPSNITIRKAAFFTSLFILTNWIIICASHLFYQIFLPIKDYTFMSSTFKELQKAFLGFMPRFPVPLPSSYIRSMDAVMYFDQLGGGFKHSLNGPVYLLGKSSNYGFWYYYFVTLFYKLPISILLLWIGSICLFIRNFQKSTFTKTDVFLILPAVYFLIYMNFFYSTQLGVRHIMIIFPVLFVFSGKMVAFLLEKKKILLYVLFAYQIVSVFRYFPDFLPYTNEFILDKKLAYKKFADSSLGYGEAKNYLSEYLRQHDKAIFQPEKPMAGEIIMPASEIVNLNIATMHKYDWVRSLKPVGHIHSQYLIFDVSSRVADSLQKLYP